MAAVVGIVASLLGPAIELGKCILAPIKRQFNYLCCINNNLQNLRDEAEKLADAGAGLQMRVTTAENNAEVIFPHVKTWFDEVDEIQEKKTEIEREIMNTPHGCLTIKSLFSLSKKAKKTAEAMKKLRECCNFSAISHPPPPASMVPIPLRGTYEFESRKHIEDDIMTTLRGKNVHMIGICGMGGVGKTTMAKRVMNRVREEHLFDETVIVVVSQQVDMSRIQDDIAQSLGLQLEEGSLSSKSHKLHTRLTREKRILIVFDDVWEKLKLEDLGIPYESDLNGCTILLTSRNKDVFNAMNVQKVYAVEVLSETEASYLFKSKVGTYIDDRNVLSVAEEVIKECKGLPLALVTVGLALKEKKSIAVWKDALQQLKSSNPTDMPEVLEDVYKPLRLSYELLQSEHAKSSFLLCCLFAEDYNILVEDLAVYAMGLHMFEEIKNLEQARNRMCSLVEMLKSRFLLLDGEHEDFVKMHDVVRDVAIFIASEERRLNCSDCTWISPFVQEGSQFPLALNANLRLLLIDNSRKEESQMNDNFFEGTRELNVLSISNDSMRSLPPTTQLLKNLRSLVLYSCRSLENISVIGELVSLEILICSFCGHILELPVEIKRLSRLKLLEFGDCWNLGTIVPGVISSLVGLEELKLLGSFSQWEAEVEGKERKNASLNELQSLSCLTCLEIDIEDSSVAAEQIHLSSNIVRYDIRIGRWSMIYREWPHSKKMHLALERDSTVGNWVHKLLRSTEGLHLEGDGTSSLIGSQYQNLKSLDLMNMPTVKRVVDWRSATSVFPLLEYLSLDQLENLEEIWDGSIPDGSDSLRNLKVLHLVNLRSLKHLLWESSSSSPCPNNVVSLFCNLSSIWIEKCDSLRNVFSLGTAKGCLLQLERLGIDDCHMMEEVVLVSYNEEEENLKDVGRKSRPHIAFPKLKRVELQRLPRLTAFYKGIESIDFPVLTEMIIRGCPNLKSGLPATTSPGNN